MTENTSPKPVTKAVIPAAGLGTRFLPATKASPKEMLPVVDRPAIQYVVQEAVDAGLDDVLMITGRSKRALEDHFDRVPALEAQLKESGKDALLSEVEHASDLGEIHYLRQQDPQGLGHAVLRAKIDMASPNINLRDPAIYRIKHAHHHNTGDKWCIYPNYDFTHGQSDAIEGITHSICTLEFEGHRPLYEWFLDNLPVPTKPRQYEFSRLNLTYVVTSFQLGVVFPDPTSGVMGSTLKFLGIFALTQIPIAIAEGLVTVLVMDKVVEFEGEGAIREAIS